MSLACGQSYNSALSATEVTHAEWHVPMFSTLGYDDTPKENTWGVLSTVRIQSSRKRK